MVVLVGDPRLRGDDALAKTGSLGGPAPVGAELGLEQKRSESWSNGNSQSDPRLRGDDALAKAVPLYGTAPVRHLASTKM